MLKQRLQWEHVERQKRASRRYEQQQRALLEKQLYLRKKSRRIARQKEDVTNKPEQRQRDLFQHALLRHRLEMERNSRRSVQKELQNSVALEPATQQPSNTEVAVATPTTLTWDDLKEVALQEHANALIRIACAYNYHHNDETPTLHPRHVHDVSIISMTPSAIDVAILVCHGGGGDCVNVAVPIPLPKPLKVNENDKAGALSKEWLVDNIQILDATAHKRIAQNEWQTQNFEQVQSNERLRLELQERPTFAALELPDWWRLHQDDIEVQKECDILKGILNETDFQNEIVALAKRVVSTDVLQLPHWLIEHVSENHLQVTQAGVAMVGSAGLYIRANVVVTGGDDNEPRSAIVPLSLRYPQDYVARSPDQLRSVVLGLIDSVAVS